MRAVNSRDAHERGVMYAEAYIAWVDCIRWSVDPKEWYDLLHEAAQFKVTARKMALGIRRREKGIWTRLVLSSHLASGMADSNFRQVFECDRMLKALSA